MDIRQVSDFNVGGGHSRKSHYRVPARGNVCCPDMVPELILACEPGKEAIQIGIS